MGKLTRIRDRETRFLSSATSGAQRILGKIACKLRSDGAELVFVKTSETVTRDKKRMANSVPSNDFRNNCGTHFGPISLPVSKVAVIINCVFFLRGVVEFIFRHTC